MKKFLFLLFLFISSPVYAGGQVTLVTPDGKVFGSAANPLVTSGTVTKSITETASTESKGATDTITSPLVGSVSGAVQVGRLTELTTSGTGSLTGTGHTIGLMGRNVHSGSGTLGLYQIAVEGVSQNTGNGTVAIGVGVASHLNNFPAGSTYTNFFSFYPEYSNLGGTFTGPTVNLVDYYSPDHSGVSGIPSNRYGYANLDSGKKFYTAGKMGINVASPSGPLVVNYPSTQTIDAGNTVTDDGCGTLKPISSAGAVTTNTTDTFTAPSTANTGCCMYVFNVGANNITLDNNAKFFSAGGANVVLTQFDVVQVCSYGSTAWVQVGPLIAN